MNIPRFVVIAVTYTAGGQVVDTNTTTRAAGSLEAAMAAHQQQNPRAQVYGISLNGFIEVAAPHRRSFKVTRLTRDEVIVNALTQQEAERFCVSYEGAPSIRRIIAREVTKVEAA